jgi:hypothetical protein
LGSAVALERGNFNYRDGRAIVVAEAAMVLWSGKSPSRQLHHLNASDFMTNPLSSIGRGGVFCDAVRRSGNYPNI